MAESGDSHRRIVSGIKAARAIEREEGSSSSTIPISHRRLAVTPFHFLFSSLPYHSLFPFRVRRELPFSFLIRVCIHTPPHNVLSSLFRDSRNRVLPARKLLCSLWLFSVLALLPILPVILRRTLHVLVRLALGITSEGRREPSCKQMHHSGRHVKSGSCYHRQD